VSIRDRFLCAWDFPQVNASKSSSQSDGENRKGSNLLLENALDAAHAMTKRQTCRQNSDLMGGLANGRLIREFL
jgi:hypothetical protein